MIVVEKESDIPRWLDYLPELKIMADIEPFFIHGGKSSEIGPEEWQKIAKAIAKNYKKFDGFVAIHEVETLPYTASALSFMLQNLGKPVVLSGSPLMTRGKKIFKDTSSYGLRANLINALQIACSNTQGVLILLGSQIVRGIGLTKATSASLYPFEAKPDQILGKIDFGLNLFKQSQVTKKKFKFYPKIENRVQIIDFYPGLESASVFKSIKETTRGLLINLQELNHLPSHFAASLAKLSKKIVVVIYSKSFFEEEKGDFIFINNISLINSIVKLMWALGLTYNKRKVKKLMEEDLAGEIIKR